MLDKIIKYLPLATLVTVLGIGIAVGKFVIEEAQQREQDKQKMHTSPEQRILLEQHLENVDEDYKQRMRFQEHVDDVFHEITETAKQLKEQRKQDSIIRSRDVITNYQTKKNVDTLLKFWKDYNAKAGTD